MISNLLGRCFPISRISTRCGETATVWSSLIWSRCAHCVLCSPRCSSPGRHDPIVGVELIDASLGRLHDAVDWVHRETLDGINAGTDLWTLMRDIRLPPHLRVGEGYGKVPWAVRTIWESYVGWFKLRSTTELYPDQHLDALAVLANGVGIDTTVEHGRNALLRGETVVAILLAESALSIAADHPEAIQLMKDAHQQLLDAGGEANFWESGWLRSQMGRWAAQPD